jgi:hypothetical protein
MDRIEGEREGASRALPAAWESLTLAQANYSLTQTGLKENSAVNARTAAFSAMQELKLVQTGPRESEIATARLRVEVVELALEQIIFGKERALAILSQRLYPGKATIHRTLGRSKRWGCGNLSCRLGA